MRSRQTKKAGCVIPHEGDSVMRKFLVLCLTAALLLTALALPPLSGAARVDKPAKRGPAAPSNKAVRAESAKPEVFRAANFGESAPLSEISAAQAKVAV